MDEIRTVVDRLKELVAKPRSRCVIESGDDYDEATLMGTRDGYINLAVAILELVSACDDPARSNIEIDRDEESNSFWSDHVRKSMHDLPGSVHFIGFYLFDGSDHLVNKIISCVGPNVINEGEYVDD